MPAIGLWIIPQHMGPCGGLKAREHPQTQLHVPHIQAGAVMHTQIFAPARPGLVVHLHGAAMVGFQLKPVLPVIGEPAMLGGHARNRQENIAAAPGADNTFPRHWQDSAGGQLVIPADRDQFAYVARVGQQAQAFLILAAILPIPAEAAPHDQGHQKKEPVPCALSYDFIDFCRHREWLLSEGYWVRGRGIRATPMVCPRRKFSVHSVKISTTTVRRGAGGERKAPCLCRRATTLP